MALTACAGLGQRSVTITQSELQNKIAEQLELPISVLQIFDIRLSNPVLRLDAGSDRLYADMDTGMVNPLNGQALLGKLSISGKLRFDESDNAIKLSESRVENLSIPGLDGRYDKLIAAMTSRIGAEILNNTPLYTLTPETLYLGGTHYVPKEFKVMGNSLRVTLVPQSPVQK